MTARVLDELPPALANADNLPSVPGVAVEVLRLSKDENAGIDEFANAIARDPALAAKLLKLSNSSLFSLSQDVATLNQATMILGLKSVQLMSLSFSLTNSVPRDGGADGFQFSEYWRRSLVGSVAGRSFCRLLGLEKEDEAFMCGLLAHFGQLVMVQCMSDEYAEVLETAEGWPDRTDEQRLLGFDHGVIGGTLFRSWDLPEIICSVVSHMHDPAGLPEDTDEDIRALCNAMHMATLTEKILCNEKKGEPMRELREISREQGIPEDQLDDILIGLEVGIREAAELLDLEIEPDTDYTAIVNEARSQVVNISLGTAATLQKTERRAHNLEIEKRQLATEATTDKLTGIANRAGFDATLEKEVVDRIELTVPNALGLLMIDVDKFKNFNDSYGHRAGDRVLKIVGNVLKKMTRDTDQPARYGGEEFAVIVPQTTPTALKTYAERIRETIASVPLPIDDDTVVNITVSIGGALLVKAAEVGDSDALVELADQHLYKCKEGGRNCTRIADQVLKY